MKKIAILVDQIYLHGGIEKLVAIKANYWSNAYGYDVTVICTEQKEKKPVYDLSEKVKVQDLKINYNRSRSYFSVKNLIKLFKNLLGIQKYILTSKPDDVIVASHIPITYLLPFIWLGKTKINKEIHYTQYFKANNVSLKGRIMKRIESLYNRIVVLSEEEKKYQATKNAVSIPNPIVEHNEEIIPFENKKEVAIAMVRFSAVKRVELLVDTFDKFSKTHPVWKLRIFGDDSNEYSENIRNLIKEKRLEKLIFLMGTTKEVYSELNQAKAYLLTSEHECFPMVVLESQSMGVPVIAFDCPTGPRNIINSGSDGILVPNDDVDSFVKSLRDFADDKKLQKKMSENSIRNSKKYGIDTIMQFWKEKIFNDYA